MFKKSSVASLKQSVSHAGLTLVEVVGGLVILATLLVSLLMAFNAHARQIKLAAAQLEAIELTDQLIAGWYAAGQLPAPGEEGTIPSKPTLSWRVMSVATDVSPVPARVMRVEVVDTPAFGKPETLSSVEILAPAAKERK